MQQLADARHRQLLLICGEQAWCYQQSSDLFASFADTLTLSTTASFNQAQWPEHLHQILGQEFSLVIYDGYSGIHPNKLAAASGTVKAGGMLVLLLPELESLSHWLDPAISRWCSAEQQLSKSHFLRRWQTLWQQQPPWQLSQQHGWHLPNHYSAPPSQCGITAQQQVLKEIQQRLSTNTAPILLSADRGRGKSALLGLLAAQLPQQSFILCSRHFHALKSCFSMLAQELGTPYAVQQKQLANLSYMAPDVLLQQHHNLDPNCIILVDEAAALPVPTLMAISQLGHRCVFASTLIGYEGNGRGYTLRFKRFLAAQFPHFAEYNLHLPIRYNHNDPLELHITKLFALECKTTPVCCQGDLSYQVLSQAQLATNEALLQQVFSLLVLAHYQTSVDDLRQLLDAPDLRLYAVFNQQDLVAVSLVIVEGGLSEPLCQSIMTGQRRPAGHLMAQQLATSSGDIRFVQQRGARIVRIAVQPECQGRGIGTALLKYLQQQLATESTYIGSSFGCTTALVNFWQKAGFTPVKLGFKKDKASGEYAMIVLHQDQPMLAIAGQFKASFFYQLQGQYQQLDSDLVAAILASLASTAPPAGHQALFCHLAVNQQSSEQQIAPVLWQQLLCTPQVINLLTTISKALIIRLVLQQQSSQHVITELGLTGKKALIKALREALREVYAHTVDKN